MTFRIQFTQDGKSFEISPNQDVHILVNGASPTGAVSQINLSNAVMTVTGVVPWGDSAGVEMVVNIPQLKVRESKVTTGEPLGILMLGEKLTVSKTSEKGGKVTWRQIITPTKYAGKWVGESFEGDANPYLIAGSSPTFVAASVATPAGATASSSTPSPAAPGTSSTVAPLTGRFSLVNRKGFTALAIDGDSRPKLGVNIRELAYFGTPQWQWTRENWLGNYASTTKGLGMKWVRFFVAHVAFSTDQIVARTRKVLDSLAQQGLLAVVCFADSLSEKGMMPKGDEQWHTGSRGHVVKDYFNNGNYRSNYLPFVQRIVTEFKDHPAVGMWQLMNELAIYNPPANDTDVQHFTAFVDETSEAIYKLDTVHPISIGIINTAHIMPPGKNIRQFAKDFYSKRKHIHVVTCHCYQYDHETNPAAMWEHEENCAIDAEIAKETGRAMMWTEFGAMNAGDRRASTERFLNQHFVKGNASAALQWGFMLELDAIPDSGIGDSRYGYSQRLNSHYDQLTDLFTKLPGQA